MFDIGLIIPAGLAFAGFWLVLLFLVSVVQVCFAWIDDGEAGNNILVTKIMEVRGFTTKESKQFAYEYYRDGDGEDGYFVYLAIPCLLALIPLFVFLYQLTLPIVLFVLIMHIARFVRRLQKKFDLHCSDENAHNAR